MAKTHLRQRRQWSIPVLYHWSQLICRKGDSSSGFYLLLVFTDIQHTSCEDVQ